MLDTRKIEIKTGLKAYDLSNLWLRNLWADFRKFDSFFSFEFPTKIGELKSISIGVITFEKSESCGVEVEYSQTGIVDLIRIYGVEEGDFSLMTSIIKNSLNLLEENSLNDFWVSFPISYQEYPISNYIFDEFRIIKNSENENYVLVKSYGYDIIDAITFTKRKVDFFLGVLSVFTQSTFSHKGGEEKIKEIVSEFIEHEFIENSFVENSHTGENKLYGLVGEEFFFDEKTSLVLREIFHGFDNYDVLFNATILFYDGLKVESVFIDSNRILREVAHTMYISSLEVLALLYKEDNKKCEACGQIKYGIVKGVYDLIRLKSPSEKIAALIKKEYHKRSSFLHRGESFSSNNDVGYHIPQLSLSDTTGNILQNSLSDVTYNLRVITRHCILDELFKIKSKSSRRPQQC